MELLKSSLPLLSIVFYLFYNSIIKKRIVEPKNHILLYLYKMLVMSPFIVTSYLLHTSNMTGIMLYCLLVGSVLGYINIVYAINNRALVPVKEHKGFGYGYLWRYLILFIGLYSTIGYTTNVFMYAGLIFLISIGLFYTRYIYKAPVDDVDFLADDEEEVEIDYKKMSDIVEKFITDNPGISVNNPYKEKIDDGNIFEFEFKISK